MKTPNTNTNEAQEPASAGCHAADCSLLLSQGWKEYPNQMRHYARCFFKKFDTPTRCNLNSDKAGVQICIAVSEWQGNWSYEIELSAELPDETWIKLHNYGMPKNIEVGLATIPRLLNTWEFLANVRAHAPLTGGERRNSGKVELP